MMLVEPAEAVLEAAAILLGLQVVQFEEQALSLRGKRSQVFRQPRGCGGMPSATVRVRQIFKQTLEPPLPPMNPSPIQGHRDEA
jgi:hypothetical protein